MLLGLSNGLDLSGDDGEGGERDTVELIEATPETRLANTLEDLGHISVFVLVRAVGDDDENTKGSTEILDSLCFTGTSWACRSTTIKHTESLRKGDVASIGKRSDTESLLGTEELIGVSELDISDLEGNFTILSSPGDSGVLGPGEIVSVLDLVLLAIGMNLIENFFLMDMNCDDCLNSHSLEWVHILKAHLGKLGHKVVDILLLLVELNKSLLLTSLEAVIDLLSPEHLDTEKRNLGLIAVDEFSVWHGHAVLSTSGADLLDRSLHLILEFDEPLLNVTLGSDTLMELNVLLLASHELSDLNDELSVGLVEGDSVDGIEKLLEVILDSIWVGTNGQDLKQVGVGAEVESWEDVSLGLKIVLKLLLADLKSLLETTEGGLQDFVGAALDDVLLLSSSLHDLEPLLVNTLELLGLSWHLFGDITGGEDRYEVSPEGLDLKPLLDNISDIGEKGDLLSDDGLEWSDVSHGVHLVESHDVLFKLLLNLLDVTTECAWSINTLPGHDHELSDLPMSSNVLVEFFLEFQLLVGGVSDILDIILEVKKWGSKELGESESLTVVWNWLLGHFDDFFPMSWSDRWLGKSINQWNDLIHIFDLLLEFLVGIPTLEDTWKSGAISDEDFDDISHVLDLILDFVPSDILPFGDGILDLGVQVVEFVEELDLTLGLHEFWVALMWETEKSLTSVVGVELSLSDTVLIGEHSESVQGFLWLNAWNHRTVLLEVLSEVLDIIDQDADTLNEVLLEVGLLTLEIVSDSDGLLDQLAPIFLEDGGGVHLFLLHDLWEIGLEEVVHLDDWSELDLNLGLLLSDFLEGVHDVTKRIDILSWLLDLEFDLLDVIGEMLEHGAGSLVEILGIGVFPLLDPLLETGLDILSLETKSTDLVEARDERDLLLESGEFSELLLEVLKLRVGGVELLESLVDLSLPEPVVLLEALKELDNVVLGTLDRTGKKKDDLNDFLILGNPVIEWLSVLLWLILLVPVLDILGRLKDVTGSSVDSALNLVKSWLKSAGITLKVNIDLEEWLQNLLWHVSSTADSLFHLVEGIFGGVEKGLIHGPVVVFGELLNFLGGDWLNMLVKLIGADGLNEIFNCTFDLVVLGLELLGLLSDPLFLHFDELVKSEGLSILWEVDKNGLGKTLEVVLNSVLHDIVDVDDELLELGKTLMNVVEVAIDVHGSPGQGDHTWSELVLKIFKMWHKKTLGVWSDLVDDSVVLSEDELELVVVHLELVFLQKNDLGTLWDINSDSGEALSFSDEGKDLRVEVNIELVVLWVTDYESGLKTSLGLLDLMGPFLSPEILEGEESITDLVIHLDESL